ncbi:MAG TPA: hypothetical protein VFG30_27375, partial [Polyangiales bacterium]|nr:hypothetical protein [Polyangiales bacterium]
MQEHESENAKRLSDDALIARLTCCVKEVQALHMSEAEAWLRIRAARFGREFPTALAMVARGELNMTALKLLARVLTPSNIELLDEVRFKSKLEIQTLIAKHFPQPD